MNILQQLDREQIEKLGRDVPDFQPGDTLIVNVKVKEGERTRVQAYEGVCIARAGAGFQESFTVRKISYGEGVERVFPLYSPMIDFDQGRAPRQGPARQALLPARPPRQVGPHRRAHRPPGRRPGEGRDARRRRIGPVAALWCRRPGPSRPFLRRRARSPRCPSTSRLGLRPRRPARMLASSREKRPCSCSSRAANAATRTCRRRRRTR